MARSRVWFSMSASWVGRKVYEEAQRGQLCACVWCEGHCPVTRSYLQSILPVLGPPADWSALRGHCHCSDAFRVPSASPYENWKVGFDLHCYQQE